MANMDKKTSSLIVDGVVAVILTIVGVGVKIGGNEIKKNIGKK